MVSEMLSFLSFLEALQDLENIREAARMEVPVAKKPSAAARRKDEEEGTGTGGDGGPGGAVQCEECCGLYVTDLCGGRPRFDCGKGHNHCVECPGFGECIGDIRPQLFGKIRTACEIFEAFFGRDGEAGGNRQADAGHFRKIGTLAASDGLVLLPRIRMRGISAEGEDCIVHIHPGLSEAS